MEEITQAARRGAVTLGTLSTKVKNDVLGQMASGLDSMRNTIIEANSIDLENANKKGMPAAFIDRLHLDDNRIDNMVKMLRDVVSLNDPVGDVLEIINRPNGLVIEKISVPVGVIGIIYESRPNVTCDCIALCFKSGNAVILRGGSDAINSNKAIYKALKSAADESGIHVGAFQLIEDTSRETVNTMLKSQDGIDLILPRGGESLIREVTENSTIPVIKHYKGICHIYVDSEADLDIAEKICINAKVQRPGVCNAMETMLVHETVAEDFIPKVSHELKSSGVRIKGCVRTKELIDFAEEATQADFSTEWLDLILNVRIVNNLDEALEHIARYGSHHSDAIITENCTKADKFSSMVDSAAVYVNASTRFTDGSEFGKGAEIGISTDKLHARGPVGLRELTTYKYVIHGTGQVRD